MCIRRPSLTRLSKYLHCAFTVLVFVAALATPASASVAALHQAPPTYSGSVGLRLLDVPVSAQDDPRARLYIVDHLAPGTVIARRIEISNTAASPVHVALYASAATIDRGSFLGVDGHTQNDLSTWTSVSPDVSDVPANGRGTAAVAISVPGDAAPGEQYAVVWAEVRSASPAGGGVIQVSRVGIRLYVSVGPGGPPAADFTIDALTASRSPDGQPTVVATVHNTGGRALDMNGTLQLSGGPGGLSAGPFPATLGVTLAIGETEPITIVLDERVPAGPWNAGITLRSGLLERSARAIITFPDKGTSPAVRPEAPESGWAPPVIVALTIVMLSIGALLVVRARRRVPARGKGARTRRRSTVRSSGQGRFRPPVPSTARSG